MPEPLLELDGLEVAYDGVPAVRSLHLRVDRGEVVGLIGPNGAGKSTTLHAVMGLVRPARGEIRFAGKSIRGRAPEKVARAGIALVPEGRRIYPNLTVDENLRAGAYSRRDRGGVKQSYDKVLDLFPVLKERHRQTAGYLSGGEQQMVAMARAMMAAPKLLLLDEPSLGLAPLIVQQIRDLIVEINNAGTSVLLVEQNATMALSIAARGYVLENGGIVKDGPGQAMLADSDIQEFYLGVGEAGHRSFRDLKSYRRRKRWTA